MKKGNVIAALGLLSALLLTSGCASQTESVSLSDEEDVQVYALVTKAEGNTYNDLMAEGFQQVIDEAGGNGIIASPAEATAEAQLERLRDLISQGVDSIAVAANDSDALSSVLQEAMAQGIQVSTVDSDVNAADRQIFVNQVSTKNIARTLVEAVYDISGGSASGLSFPPRAQPPTRTPGYVPCGRLWRKKNIRTCVLWTLFTATMRPEHPGK